MPQGWWAEVFARTKTSLQQLESSMDGGTIERGSISGALKMLQSNEIGNVPEVGSISSSLFGLQTAMAGREDPQGSIASSLWTPRTALAGGTGDLATIATVLAQTVTAINGGQTDPGTMATVLKQAITALVGQQSQSGSIATALKQAITAIVGNIPVSIAFDSVQAGYAGYSFTGSWNHTPVAALVTMIVIAAIDPATITSVTCAGSAMSQVASNVNIGNLTFWKLAGVAGGAARSMAVNTVNSGTQGGITAMSIAYTGVNSIVSAALSGNGTGTAMSAAVTLGAAARILQAFGAFNGGASGASISSPSGGTNRTNASQGQYSGLCVSDATATTTFTATGSPSFYSGWNTQALLLS